ncbi:MAG: hypothetical protein ACE5JI_11905 [Acidobacteriota bacterium]
MKATSLLIGGLMSLPGCLVDARTDVTVEQPLEFSHAKHTQYFLDGRHKAEHITWHLQELGEEEAPVEILDGACLECHDTLEDKPKCSGCHLIFQDELARKNQAQRPCLGCHRTAWTSYQASIPTIEVCRSCHGERPRTSSQQEKILREYIENGEDIPWVQINTLVDHVHFSHVAHIRLAELGCMRCHPQDTGNGSMPQLSVSSMSDCIDCHKQREANNDCLACHK